MEQFSKTDQVEEEIECNEGTEKEEWEEGELSQKYDFLLKEPSQISSFLQFVWDKSSYEDFLTICLELITSGRTGKEKEMNVKEYLFHLKENSRHLSQVCGAVFKVGSIIVTCKTCGLDPTCAICIGCFERSSHEGHDYNIHASGGGMCDCGDPLAWRESGFCSQHCGAKEEGMDPSQFIPSSMISLVHHLFSALLDILLLEISKETSSSLLVLLNVLSTLQEFNEAFRNILGKEMIKDNRLHLFLQSHYRLKPSVRLSFYHLYTSLIVDYHFKPAFTFEFMQFYEEFYQKYNQLEEGKGGKGILEMSVQLLTVSTIVLDLSKHHQLLDVLLQVFLNILRSSSLSSGIVNPSHPSLVNHLHWRVSHDLRYALTNLPVSQFVFFHSSSLLPQIIELAKLMQGMEANKREEKQHISREKDVFRGLNLELELLKTFDILLRGLKAGKQLSSTSSQSLVHVASIPLDSFLSILRFFLPSFQEDFLRLSSTESKKEKNQCDLYSDIQVEKTEMSLHLPLHRFFAMILHLSTLLWNFDLSSLFSSLFAFPVSVQSKIEEEEKGTLKAKSENDETSREERKRKFVKQWMEQVIRIQVFVGQVESKMWVRNGETMNQLVYFYKKSSYSSSTYFYDLFTLQLSASLLSSFSFLAISLHRWNLSSFFFNGLKKEAICNVEYLPSLVSSFFSYLLSIFDSSSMFHLSSSVFQERMTRRYLIHRLAIKDSTHSKLLDSIPSSFKSPNFDDILFQISDSFSTDGKNTFRLRDSLWLEFEGRNWPFYSPSDLDSALSNFARSSSSSSSFPKPFSLLSLQSQSSSSSTPIPFPLASVFLPLFSSRFLNCRLFLRFIFVILDQFLSPPPLLPSISEIAVEQSLLLLLLLLSFSSPLQEEKSKGEEEEEEGGEEWIYQSGYEEDDIYQNLRVPVQSHFSGNLTTVLDLLMTYSNHQEFGKIANFILQVVSQKDPSVLHAIKNCKNSSDSDNSKEEEEQKRRARERKEKIMQQMAAQRLKFTMSQGEDFIEDEDESFEKDEKKHQCCLCLEYEEEIEEKGMTLISFATSTFIPPTEAEGRGTELERISLFSCGHEIHHKCFQSYFESLEKRHSSRITYEGRGIINLEKGEFLCPNCRKIANCLLPITEKEFERHQNRKPFSFWENEIKERMEKTQDQEHHQETIAEETVRSFLMEKLPLTALGEEGLGLSTETNTLCLWKTAINSINSLEYSLRREDLGWDYLHFKPKSMDPIHFLLFASLQLGSTSFSIQRSSFSCLYNLISLAEVNETKEEKEEEEEKKEVVLSLVPFQHQVLETNIFHFYLTLLFSSPHLFERGVLSIDYVDHLNFICFTLVIIQSILTLHPKLQIEEPNSLLDSFQRFLSNEQNAILTLIVPFLRKLFIVNKCFAPTSTHDFNFPFILSQKAVEDEARELLILLNLDLNKVFEEGSIGRNRLSNWINKIPKWRKGFQLKKPNRFQFAEGFPFHFEELLVQTQTMKCPTCDSKPKNPAICLFCFRTLCVNESCCPDKDGSPRGECARHAKECSGGKGAVFIVKSCSLFLIRHQKNTYTSGSSWNAIYLDKYGEEDPHFKRGKPLTLSKERVDSLRNLWLSGNWEDEILKKAGGISYEL